MDDEMLDHLHAWVRHMYRPASVEVAYETILRFLDSLDEADRDYFIAQGWPRVDEACATKIGEALVAAGI